MKTYISLNTYLNHMITYLKTFNSSLKNIKIISHIKTHLNTHYIILKKTLNAY